MSNEIPINLEEAERKAIKGLKKAINNLYGVPSESPQEVLKERLKDILLKVGEEIPSPSNPEQVPNEEDIEKAYETALAALDQVFNSDSSFYTDLFETIEEYEKVVYPI